MYWFQFAAVSIGVIAATCFVIWIIWWRFPRWQIERFHRGIKSPEDRAEVEDSFRKTIGQFFAGIGFIAVILLTLQELTDARMSRTEQLREDREQRVADQFSRALSHVANESRAIRIGGIYTLEQVFLTVSAYHAPVVEVLSTYVRTQATREDESKADIRAAIIVIGRIWPKLRGTYLPNLKGVNLRTINLSNVDLSELVFSGADLSGANLNHATMRKTHFKDAKFHGATLERATAVGANFTRADFSSADVGRFSDKVANFEGADLTRARFVKAKLRGAFFFGTKLVGADLRQADLSRADLRNADLSGAQLQMVTGLLSAQCNKETKLPNGYSTSHCKFVP